MLQLRKLLTARYEWFEVRLQQLAEEDGYGHLSPPMVHLCAHIGKEPVPIVTLARQLSVSRQWVNRLAREGQEMGILELTIDPADRRAMRVSFSSSGWKMVRLAVARMNQIEEELAARIGKDNLEQLVALLAMDWGDVGLPELKCDDDEAHSSGRRKLA